MRFKNIIFFFVIIALVYSFFYPYAPAKPAINNFEIYHEKSGWELWYDQGQYYKMSEEFARGTFDQKDYVYPLGYTLLGVPFVLFSQDGSFLFHHRYFIPNLLILFGVTYMSYNLTCSLTQNYKAGILCIALLLFFSPLLLFHTQPWSNHVTGIAMLGIFYLLWQNSREMPNRTIIMSSLFVGWIFSARYVDIFWAIPFFITFLILYFKKWKYLLPGVALILLVPFSHYYYFEDPFQLPHQYRGAIPTYDRENNSYEPVGLNKYDFDLSIISTRIYCVLLEPLHCLPEETGITKVDNHWYNSLHDKIPFLIVSPFLIISPFGVYIVLRKYPGNQRWILVSMLIAFVASVTYYSAANAFHSGWTIFFRFYMFWLPFFTIFSVYAMNHIYQKAKVLVRK